MDLGTPIGAHLETCSYVSVIWSVNKSIWIAVMKFDNFLMENVMVSDAPTSQIWSKYRCFHSISLFQVFHEFDVSRHVFGALEVSGQHFDDF